MFPTVWILILKSKYYWLTVWHTKMGFSISWRNFYHLLSNILEMTFAHKTRKRIALDENRISECYRNWTKSSFWCWMCCQCCQFSIFAKTLWTLPISSQISDKHCLIASLKLIWPKKCIACLSAYSTTRLLNSLSYPTRLELEKHDSPGPAHGHHLVAKFSKMCHFWHFLRVSRTWPKSTDLLWKI